MMIILELSGILKTMQKFDHNRLDHVYTCTWDTWGGLFITQLLKVTI